jgi:hypothetical protein
MEKYLFFNTGANSSECLPASRLIDMSIGNGETLNLHFKAALGGDDGVGEILRILTITDNTGRDILNAIAEEIRLGKQPFIIVVDETTGEKLHDGIVSVNAIATYS